MGNLDIYTIAIIVSGVIVSFQGFSNPALFERFKFNPVAVIKAKQYDRLLTSGFLHVDQSHLIFNYITLYFFAPVVVSFYGGIQMIVIFLVSILGGNLLSLYMHKDNAYYNAVGASGGVSGILFAAIANKPDMMLGIMFVIPMPAWIFAILYLGYSIYGMKRQLGNIGHSAHLGGAIIGFAFAIIQNPDLFFGPYRMYVIGMLIPILVLGGLLIQEKR